MTLKIGSLFTGYGGLDMAVHAVFPDAETVWVSDIDKGASKILAHRYPTVPNLGDITGIDWTQVEPVDILTGGFPCQDVSHAGKRAGLKDGTRSGLWSHMAEAVQQLQPSLVVAENVRGLLSAASPSDVEPCPWCVGDEPVSDLRALGTVLADLADIGYDARWCGLRAADVGSCHGRFRVFLIAYPSHPEGWRSGRQPIRETPQYTESGSNGGRPSDVALLPTPNPFHSGNDEEPDEWRRQRRLDVFERTGTRHGPALSNAVAEYQQDTFGAYAKAITRWEPVVGRPAPAPTEPRPSGRGRLSPTFVEWMMGLPEGWVADVPGLSWAEKLKALGNGVVPQQAEAGLRHMLGDL